MKINQNKKKSVLYQSKPDPDGMNPVRGNPVRNIVSKRDAEDQTLRTSNGMKVLIGTPIHESKDYAMERWLKSVFDLIKKTPTDILLVDCSPGTDYVEKIERYCRKYKIKPKILHFEIWQYQSDDEKITRAREIIRQYVLSRNYDAWFSWECDQIIPANTLKVLSDIMFAGNYAIVHPGTWSKEVQLEPEVSFAICLIHKDPLKKNGFLFEYPNMSGSSYANETLFKKRVISEGGSVIEVYGMIKPIYHLDKPNK